MSTYLLDPQACLDFRWSWSAWLATDETILTALIEADTGIEVAPSGYPTVTTDTDVTVWLTGGTVGDIYDVTCRVTTSAGRTDDRTIRIRSYQR